MPPTPDHWPGSLIRVENRAPPNTNTSVQRMPRQQPATRERQSESPPFGQSLFGEHPHLRFELFDAAGEVVDQLALWIG
jgi:hypothetical protein